MKNITINTWGHTMGKTHCLFNFVQDNKLGNRLIMVYDVLALFSFTLRLPVTVYSLLD